MPTSPASPHPGRIGPNGAWKPSRFGGSQRVTSHADGSINNESVLFTLRQGDSSTEANTVFSVGTGTLMPSTSSRVYNPYRQGYGFMRGVPYVLVKVHRGAPTSDWLLSSE